MPTPNFSQQAPGYATITIPSVSSPEGFRPEAGELQSVGVFDIENFPEQEFERAPVIPPTFIDDSSDDNITDPVPEAFLIGIHSVDSGQAGVGSGNVGDDGSLIGLKVLETGTHTDVLVPIYPIQGTTNVRRIDVSDEKVQQFPPAGGENGPKIQAAIYTSWFVNEPTEPFDFLPEPVATSSVVTVTNGLDQNPERFPLVPDPVGGGLTEKIVLA